MAFSTAATAGDGDDDLTSCPRSHAPYSALLASQQQRAHLMAVLCRTLSVSATFLNGRYCQGMSFLAASYILYCKTFIYRKTNTDNIIANQWEAEAVAAAVYHFIVLQEHQLADLYVKENALTEYIAYFEFQLLSPYSAQKGGDSAVHAQNRSIHEKLNELYEHLQLHGLDAQYFVVQWFGSCFTLNVSAEMLIYFQEIFLYSCRKQRTCNHPMIRLGIAILYILADELLLMSDFESLYILLKTRMKMVSPLDVIPVFLMFDMKEPLLLLKGKQEESEGGKDRRGGSTSRPQVVTGAAAGSGALCTCVVS
jgi:hypothetical protein